MVVDGAKIAAFDHETGELSGWFSLMVPTGGRHAETRIEIETCEDSLCFHLPTAVSDPIIRYRKAECNGAFLME